MSLFSSLFRAAKPTGVSGKAERPRASDQILQAYEAAIPESTGSELVWLARDASYWSDRCTRRLARLSEDWDQSPEHGKWPDVAGLLALLSAPPEEVIRQLPTAARDAMALCDRDDLSRAQLFDRLSQHPSLVQGILRQANSVTYGAGLPPILRVDAAIDRIGLAGTRAVIVATSVDGLLSKPGGSYDALLADTWQRMVQTAPMARALAPAFGADGEEAFAIALLHDVGLLIILDRISTVRATNRRPVALPDAWFETLVTELHEPLGAVAAHRWGLGIDAADAMGTHHRRDTPADRHPLAEVIFLADHVVRAAARGEPPNLFGVWAEGELTGDATHAQSILDRMQRSA